MEEWRREKGVYHTPSPLFTFPAQNCLINCFCHPWVRGKALLCLPLIFTSVNEKAACFELKTATCPGLFGVNKNCSVETQKTLSNMQFELEVLPETKHKASWKILLIRKHVEKFWGKVNMVINFENFLRILWCQNVLQEIDGGVVVRVLN